MKSTFKGYRFCLRCTGWLFFAVCVTLVATCCQHNVEKYAIPPKYLDRDSIRMVQRIEDSINAQKDTTNK